MWLQLTQKSGSVDPFAGTIKDGYVYGRGAYDMKCMTAIEITVLKLLKKNNIKSKATLFLQPPQARSRVAKKAQATC